VFQNGPNWGKDVFMPLDWIIGGPKMAGQGWRMLMECLAAGRSISLPSSGRRGYAKPRRARDGRLCARAQPVQDADRKFEGIEEALARIGGNLYMMDAGPVPMTAGAVDLGEKALGDSRRSSSTTLTERGRVVVNDAMDILGGKESASVPTNFMGRPLPAACRSRFTVEGANILTRNLIVLGQGAIRCPSVRARGNERRAARAT